MGWNIKQHMVVGVELEVDDIEVEVSPEIVEQQARYNTRTGEITHYETVVVKRRETTYRFLDKDFDDLEDLWGICEELGLQCHIDWSDNLVVIGKDVFTTDDLGRVDLCVGSTGLEHLTKMFDEVSAILPGYNIELVSTYTAG